MWLVLSVLCACAVAVCGMDSTTFFPFGSPDTPDSEMNPSVDGFRSQMMGGGGIKIGDKVIDMFYVSVNGILRGTEKLKKLLYFPARLANISPHKDTNLIFPYWSDVDIKRGGGNVYYRYSGKVDDWTAVSAVVQKVDSSFSANGAFVVTWNDVQEYKSKKLKGPRQVNSFQFALATNGKRTYGIYKFKKLTYSANGNAGFSISPSPAYYCVLPGSQTVDVWKLACRSNIGVAGEWVVGMTQDTDQYQCPAKETYSECAGEKSCNKVSIVKATVSPTGNALHGEAVTVTCIKHHTIDGLNKMTCNDGTYDQTPSCKASCEEQTIQNGTLHKNGYIEHGSYANVTCNEGFEMHDSITGSMICSEGEFDHTPTCKAQCTQPVITGAKAGAGTLVGHGSFMTVSCRDGYLLVGQSKMTCTNGVFDQTPTCQEITTTSMPTTTTMPSKVKYTYEKLATEKQCATDKLVSNAKECAEAAAQVGHTLTVDEETIEDSRLGCYYMTKSDELYFNKATKGEATAGTEPICRKDKIASAECEVPASTVMDMIIVLDESRSVKDNYADEISFVKSFVSAFPVSADGIRIGLVRFSGPQAPTLQFTLAAHTTTAAIITVLDSLVRAGKDTDIGGALERAATAIQDTSGGARKNVMKVIMLITDGKHNGKGEAYEKADKIRTDLPGIKFIVVGVSDAVKVEELQKIAGDNSNYYQASDFTVLISKEFENTVTTGVCSKVGGTSPKPTTAPRTTPMTTPALNCSNMNGGCSDHCDDSSGVVRCSCSSRMEWLEADRKTCLVPASYIYFINGTNVVISNGRTSHHMEHFHHPTAVTVDLKNSLLFYADRVNNFTDIGFVDLKTQNVTVLITVKYIYEILEEDKQCEEVKYTYEKLATEKQCAADKFVSNAKECAEAAAQAGHPNLIVEEETYEDSRLGCYYMTKSDELYFNNATKGEATAGTEPICRKDKKAQVYKGSKFVDNAEECDEAAKQVGIKGETVSKESVVDSRLACYTMLKSGEVYFNDAVKGEPTAGTKPICRKEKSGMADLVTDIEYAHGKLGAGEVERYLFVSTWDAARNIATVLEMRLDNNHHIQSKKVIYSSSIRIDDIKASFACGAHYLYIARGGAIVQYDVTTGKNIDILKTAHQRAERESNPSDITRVHGISVNAKTHKIYFADLHRANESEWGLYSMNSDGSCLYNFRKSKHEKPIDMTWCEKCRAGGALLWSTSSMIHMDEMVSKKTEPVTFASRVTGAHQLGSLDRKMGACHREVCMQSMTPKHLIHGMREHSLERKVSLTHTLLYDQTGNNDILPNAVALETSSNVATIHPVIKYVDEDEFHYLTVSSKTNVDEYLRMFLVVKDRHGNLTNPDFQFGQVVITTFETTMQCQRVNFTNRMPSRPAVKLTTAAAATSTPALTDYLAFYTNIWLRSTDETGFTVCYREGLAYTGRHNLTVHYIAVSKPVHDFTERGFAEFNTNRVSKAAGMHKFCERQVFDRTYIRPPLVFATVQEGAQGAGGGELFSYISEITTKSALLCARSTLDDSRKALRVANMSLNYIVIGDHDPCGDYHCPDHQQCHVNSNQKPYCGCITTCERQVNTTFCGTDHVTYENLCEKRKLTCERFGLNATSNVTVAHIGRCKYFPHTSGMVRLQATSVAPLRCANVALDAHMFAPNREMHVQLTVNWNGVKNFSTQVHHEASAAWSEKVSRSGFRVCVLIAGRHFTDTYPSPHVNWVAYQVGLTSSLDELEGGSVDMLAWYTGSRCAMVALARPLAGGQSKLHVSVEHLNGNMDAMVAWSERVRLSRGRIGTRICARELENFDGRHEGIRLHWLVIHDAAPPYVSESEDMIFPRKNVNGNQLPAMCKERRVNYAYPTLPNPVVVLSAHPASLSAHATNQWSLNGLIAWIEKLDGFSMRVCVKQVRNSMQREAVRVTLSVFPTLCEKGWDYFDGNCYYKSSVRMSQTDASAFCVKKNASLPVAQSVIDSNYLETQSGANSTWLDYEYDGSSQSWKWNTPSQNETFFTHWLKDQPSASTSAGCAVTKGGEQMGWENVKCDTANAVICQRGAHLVPRSCNHFTCLNGGTCYGMHGCKCPIEYGGARCQDKLSDVTACNSYTHLKQPLRSTATMDKAGGFCDTSLSGWHRFNDASGAKISEHCPNSRNRCGGKLPGWLEGNHPSQNEGEVKRPLRFYENSCDDTHTDTMTVRVRNCGTFYSYFFAPSTYNNCDLTVCVDSNGGGGGGGN